MRKRNKIRITEPRQSGSGELTAQATRAHAAGDLATAGRLALEATELDADNHEARLLLGVVAFKSGRTEDALRHLAQVAEQDPGSFHARMLLSVLYRQQGRTQDAVEFATQATKLEPNHAAALCQLGSCLLDRQEFGQALAAYQRATTLAPDVPAIAEGIGLAHHGLGDARAAVEAFRRASSLDPHSEPAGVRLVEALLALPDPPGAEEAARRLVTTLPQSAVLKAMLARALMDQNRGREALEQIEAAVQINPKDASIAASYGAILQNLGRIQEAGVKFQESIALNPNQGYAYSLLVHNLKVSRENAEVVSAMERLETEARLPIRQVIHLQYALGKAKQDLRDFGSAMWHFDEANRLSYLETFGNATYDTEAHAAGFRQIRNTLTRDFIQKHASCGIESDLPVFVLGMMRSGTTLVEQILSSHSEVGGCGEQRFWMDQRSKAFVGSHGELDEQALARLAGEYLESLRLLAPNARRTVDKMPTNYSIMGLIHLALPKAKFIHVRRLPVDTCLSIYTTPNRSPIQWRHHKSNIVFAYREYEKLMRHWAGALPPESVLQVNYEDLVLDREATTRKLIEFCDLEWEDACLYPENNERDVVTSSVWQVRQPVYSSSLERWRGYEPWLGEFAQLL